LESTVLPRAEDKGSREYVSFPWPPPKAALSIPNVRFFVKKIIFEEDLLKTKETAIHAGSAAI
jgi:hypothetical protein